MSILKKPEPPKKPNPTEQQLIRAKALIEAKRYEDARALLITIEHPTADKWLERLDKFAAPAPQRQPATVTPVIPTTPTTTAPQSFTVKLVVTLVLLWFFFIPGLIALTIFAKEAKQYPDAPGAGALLLLNKWIFWLLVGALLIFVISMILLNGYNRSANIYSLF